MRQAVRAHPSRIAIATAVCVATASLLTACARTRAPDGRDASPASATPRSESAGAEPTADAGAYYASLVAAHGADLSTCPPAEDRAPGACADGSEPDGYGAPRRVLLMLDASGSMTARLGGQTKLAAAQDALLGFASKLDPAAQVALRVYGHHGSNREADKAASCRGTELVLPFATRDHAAFEAAVRSFEPRGFTPIAASLQAAEQDFTRGGANADGNVVYLVSDGIETCDGDPAAAARALHASGIRVVVNVIGFDVDAAAEAQLRGVADAGGGEYISARTRADLDDVFNRRLRAATARFNCEVVEQTGAFTSTVGSHSARYTCLVGKATAEYTAVIGAASSDLRSQRATQAQFDHAVAQAEVKRRQIVEPAGDTRQRAVDAVSAQREQGVDAARREQDAALDAARKAREQ